MTAQRSPRLPKQRPAPPGEAAVYAVVTRAEAARVWRVSYQSLRYAVDAGIVAARWAGGTWLISVASLDAQYSRRKVHIQNSE